LIENVFPCVGAFFKFLINLAPLVGSSLLLRRLAYMQNNSSVFLLRAKYFKRIITYSRYYYPKTRKGFDFFVIRDVIFKTNLYCSSWM